MNSQDNLKKIIKDIIFTYIAECSYDFGEYVHAKEIRKLILDFLPNVAINIIGDSVISFDPTSNNLTIDFDEQIIIVFNVSDTTTKRLATFDSNTVSMEYKTTRQFKINSITVNCDLDEKSIEEIFRCRVFRLHLI